MDYLAARLADAFTLEIFGETRPYHRDENLSQNYDVLKFAGDKFAGKGVSIAGYSGTIGSEA